MTIDLQELKKVAESTKNDNSNIQIHPLDLCELIERIENLETTIKFFETLTRDQQDEIEKLQAKPKRSNIPCVAMDGSNPFADFVKKYDEAENGLGD